MAKRTQEQIQSEYAAQQAQIAALQQQRQQEYQQWQTKNNQDGAYDSNMQFQSPIDAQIKQLQATLSGLDNERRGLMPDGSPMRPEYESWLNTETGLMKDQYQMKPGLLDPTSLEGFQELKKRVMTQGPSAYAQMMLEKQKLEEGQQKDMAARQAQSAAAQARSQLAMKGGMSSGARERLAMGGARDLMMQRQNVASQGQLSRAGLLAEDEAQRMKLLPGFAEGEAKIAEGNLGLQNKAQEWNIMRALEEKRAKDAQDLDVYKEQIKKWGSEKEAAATSRGGGGGK